ncbi:DeoR/GlpR family DNA-binding transcription regulator [Bifidobacterium felsineum]|uniref:DeoR/GlpR family DNA-binding transcription regulator n=1 Tax=Bifidobacterium felsineum TaxID=2045440 RepID=UPI001BDC985B|nr:DeoR/GlpR family DNA-binding transcription regulator [Bifidobacterium felsineum]MBT1165063.1 DeoR/GlpR transcriptional regulator [Bifidobacterium felsineum]
MKGAERKSIILETLQSNGSVTVADMARKLDVSVMTVRRDLLELERNSLVRRVHGGAVLGRGRGYEPPYAVRSGEAAEEKRRIGVLAASQIAEGDSVAIDIGSTSLEVAKALHDRHNLTIVTPSIRVARELEDEPDIRMILTGGIIRHGELSLIGDLAEQAFSVLRVDRLILGTGAVDVKFGLSEYNWDDARVKRAMINSAKEIILVADSRKFQHVAFARIVGLEKITTVVTDQPLPDEFADVFKANCTNVLIAGDTFEISETIRSRGNNKTQSTSEES